jgi:hypothetical protein
MVVILVVSVVVVIAGTAVAMRLTSLRVHRRRKLIEVLTSATSVRNVSPMPVPRLRATAPASRFRRTATPANVEVLAEYRQVRAGRSRRARVSAGGLQRSPGPHRPGPA